MLKVITILGARPQFIKAAPVSICFQRKEVEELILHTGQHYDQSMSDVFFKELGLPAPYTNLGINRGSHGKMTSRMLIRIEEELIDKKPDIVLIYGDTNSTLAGALAAAKLHIPIAHVEAGLRSFNRKMPEEINRVLADRVSTFLFCPTETAVDNLRVEGIVDGVSNVGDVMYDVALQMSKRAETNSSIMDRLSLNEQGYVLATFHRAENTDNIQILTNILTLLSSINKELKVILPLHPRTSEAITKSNLNKLLEGVTVISPTSYLDMVNLQKYSQGIITDSGGIQKEAFFYKVPCITLRDETEWVETVQSGWNTLVSPSKNINKTDLISKIKSPPKTWKSYYGNGQASDKITNLLTNY